MDELVINGISLELDLLDADVMEQYQNLNNRIMEDVNDPKTYEGLSEADSMRKQCRLVDAFFDDLFGAGTADSLFGGGNNLGKRLEAFAQVSAYAQGQQNRVHEITERYNPRRAMNREQRRAAERNNARTQGQQNHNTAGKRPAAYAHPVQPVPQAPALTDEQMSAVLQLAAQMGYLPPDGGEE